MARSPAVKAKKTTIRDVAEDAGVSTAAVSKVLRNAYGVSDGLRTKVLESIEKLGYRPSTAARGMRGRTYCVGFLVVELQNSFLPTVVDGFKAEMAEARYKTFIGVSEARASIESSLIDSMIDMRMDGVLMIAPRLSDAMLTRYAAQIPLCVIGHHDPSVTAFDTVNSDDEAGARLAVEALIRSGRRRIHMTSLPKRRETFDVFSMRERGYLAAMQAAGLAHEARIWPIRERQDVDGPPMEAVFDGPLPDAIFCWSDIHALPLINMARTRGIDVPRDLAIVGYDDRPEAAMPLIDLSSVHQDGDQLGRLAARLLISRIEGRTEADHRLIAPTLMTRSSS